MGKIIKFEIVDMGFEAASYHQGFGTYGSQYDEAYLGAGNTPVEALDDAIEQAVSQHEFSAEMQAELDKEAEDFKSHKVYAGNHLYARFSVEGHNIIGLKDSSNEYEAVKEGKEKLGLEVDVEDAEIAISMTGNVSADDIIHELEMADYIVSSKVCKELEKALNTEDSEFYYYIGIRVKIED